MDKIKINIIGLGGIGQITHLPLLTRMDDVEVTAVCDIDKSKAKNVAKKFNVKSYYYDIDKMLEESPADALIIASPTYLHRDHALKALEKDMNILVEKPLARNYKEGAEIYEAAKKYKRKLMVGMNSLFRPDLMMLQSFASAGSLGDIYYIKTGFIKKRSTLEDWALDLKLAGGGVFMDLGVVILEIALQLMKYPKIKSVSAVNQNIQFKTVEDCSYVFIKFVNGSCINLECSWSLLREYDVFYCNVFGKEGSASINPLRIYKMMHGSLVNVTPLKMENPSNIYKRSYEYELRHFINSIQNNKDLLSSGNEALERLKITDAVYKSAKTGKEVIFK
jgi:predicted dehydrogenase